MPVAPSRQPFATDTAPRASSVAAEKADPWRTSSFGTAADTSPLELFDLREHLRRCRRARGRLFAVLSVSDAVDSFLAARFMTTVVAVAFLGVLLALLYTPA